MRVLFVTTCPCFYRVAFFRELGKYVDLTVVYEDGTGRYQKDTSSYYQRDSQGEYTVASLKAMHIGHYNYDFGLFRLIKKERFDVVVFGIIESLSCMRTMEEMHRRHMPYILNIDGLEDKDRGRLKNWAGRHFVSMAPMLLSPSKANDHVLVTLGAKQETIQRYSFASYSEKQVLSQCVTQKEREEACKTLGLVPGRYVVSVAQLIERKNPLGLLHAWKRVSSPEEMLLLIGRGPLEIQVAKMIARDRLHNVRLIPFVSPTQIPLYYRASLFSVLFSHQDAWGLVIPESLANGTPVIATDACYAATELLQNDSNGQVIADDETQLETALWTMLKKSPKELAAMSASALQSVKTYTVEQMAKEHVAIFEGFLRGEGRLWN